MNFATQITRKDILSEGSILYLPKFVIQSMEAKAIKKVKVYKPSDDDIEWAHELILHKVTYNHKVYNYLRLFILFSHYVYKPTVLLHL